MSSQDLFNPVLSAAVMTSQRIEAPVDDDGGPDESVNIGESPVVPGPEQAAPEPEAAQVAAPVKEPEQTPKETAAAERFSKTFDKLTRKELELRNKEKELKALADELGDARRLRELAKTDKLGALRELNVSADDVLRSHLNNGKPDTADEIAALREEIAELKNAVPKMRQEYSGYNEAVLEDMGNRWENELGSLIDNEEYKIVKHSPGGMDYVRDFTYDYYQKTKKLLPAKQALDIIAKSNRDWYDAVSSKLNPPPAAPTVESSAKTNGPKTVTPKLSAMPKYSYLRNENDEFSAFLEQHRKR